MGGDYFNVKGRFTTISIDNSDRNVFIQNIESSYINLKLSEYMRENIKFPFSKLEDKKVGSFSVQSD